MYEKQDNKLKVTEEKVTLLSLDGLKAERELVMSNRAKIESQLQNEMFVFDSKLSELDEKIAKCVELEIPSEKEEAIKAAALEAATIEAPIEEVIIKD